MLNTNELRRGNLVLFAEDGSIHKVEEITKDGLYTMDNEETYTWIEIEKFEGIPLTKDILLMSNFIYNGGTTYTLEVGPPYKKGTLIITITENRIQIAQANDRRDSDWIWLDAPKYLHTLQNLFFAIRGIELPVKGWNSTF